MRSYYNSGSKTLYINDETSAPHDVTWLLTIPDILEAETVIFENQNALDWFIGFEYDFRQITIQQPDRDSYIDIIVKNNKGAIVDKINETRRVIEELQLKVEDLYNVFFKNVKKLIFSDNIYKISNAGMHSVYTSDNGMAKITLIAQTFPSFKMCYLFGNVEEIIMPEVTTVYDGMFYSCEHLSKVYAPKLRQIFTRSFAKCTSLKEFTIETSFDPKKDADYWFISRTALYGTPLEVLNVPDFATLVAVYAEIHICEIPKKYKITQLIPIKQYLNIQAYAKTNNINIECYADLKIFED